MLREEPPPPSSSPGAAAGDLHDRGHRVARLLAGAWRPDPPAADPRLVDDDLVAFLERTACGPLAWARLRDADPLPPGAETLRRAHLAASLHVHLHRRRVADVARKLAGAGLDGVAAKGWVAARLYADPALRPFGDVDVWLPARLHGRAREALGMEPGQDYPVDLHDEDDLPGMTWEGLLERSTPVDAGGAALRVPSPVDHLALLAAHALREGVWRPVWLCDVAAAVEGLPRGADPDRLPEPLRHWTGVAVALARDLLGARTDGGPFAEIVPAPEWARDAVLRQWEADRWYMQTPSMRRVLAGGGSVREALRLRWPNPVEVTVRHGRRFGRRPPVRLQLVDASARAARWLGG